MGIQKSSPHMCSSFYEWKYDVFLNFRGEDTRNNFTDHLYAAFRKDGIKVFKDDEDLKKGEFISPELSKAIEASRLSVIIFSRNYASSTWCLDELLKIVQCMKTMKQMVFPVFYDVDPSDVRKQKGKFQEAFSKHEEAFKENTEKVKKWRTALTEVGNISGWDLKDRPESEFIQNIIREISKRLGHNNLSTLEGLVGIDSRMEKLRMMLMSTKTDDVRMIGIYGMGGIGKTTIASAVYDLISDEFEGRGFLANVREISQKSGIYNLQRQLLSQILKESDINIWDVYEGIRMIRSRLEHKRVLIVIDDVDDIKQLNELAGKHDWFGSGSRIIITTRDKHLLLAHGVDNLYESEELNNDEAHRLFSLKAFKNYYPPNEYVELSKHVVKYACGLPLALEVLGSFLFGRSIDQWNSALERLGKDYENRILDSLKISFDGLKETEKKIFLDVACFFKGKNKDYVTRILDGCGFSSTIGIAVLVDKSLITILKNDVPWMHDLLQEMGQWIVMRESPENPGECSRLWKEADVHDVLTRNTGTELIEGMMLEKVVGYFSLSGKVFSKMTKLRLLKICNVHLPEGLEYLSNNLSLLEWHGYPLKHLPSSLQLDKIVELKLQYSHIVRLWKETKQPLMKLKVIDLSHSKNLIRTIDFTEVPNLEELILEGCTSLCEIHQSLLLHRKLILLNLKDCTSLTALPGEVDMESLKTLILTGCNKLKKFPKFVRSMECLEELFLDKTPIKELPFQVELLKGIVLLSMKDCKNLLSLPTNISSLELLEILDVSGTAIRQPESSIFFMKNLKELSFRGCKGPSLNSCYLSFSFRLMLGRSSNPMALKLPPLSGLSSLRKLDLSDCNLEAIPGEIDSLVSLEELHLGNNNFVSLPASIFHLSKLKELTLENCKRLQSLPELPPELHIISIDDCTSLEKLSISLKSCKSLTLILCNNCLNILDCSITACAMPKVFYSCPFSLLELIYHSCKKKRSLKTHSSKVKEHATESHMLALCITGQQLINDVAEDKIDDETASDNKATSEHDRREKSSPDRSRTYDSRSKDRDRERDLKREKEREIDRYESEAQRERVRKEREQRRKIEEAEREYERCLKDWEYKEREREKERQYEKEREHKRKKEILYDEEDKDDDSRKKWHRSVLEDKKRKRLREKEDDFSDKIKEEEEIAKAKKRAKEEQLQQQQRDALKLLLGHGSNGTENPLSAEESGVETKDKIAVRQDYDGDSIHENHVAGDEVLQNGTGDESTNASVSSLDMRHSSNALARKLGFSLVGSGKRTVVPSVFHKEDDDDADDGNGEKVLTQKVYKLGQLFNFF